MKKNSTLKVAAIGDLHVNEACSDEYKKILLEISKKADYLVLCGDLTQRGLLKEVELLVQQLQVCSIPIISVLGNHDYESGRATQIKEFLNKNNVLVLDGEPVVLGDVGFAGVKGFCGGFENYMLEVWGEEMIKQFYYEGVNEAQKLENSLAKLQTKIKVVVLHYSPIKQTVIGESPEIYTYLGSSRLEEPINTFHATVVFHGHAHHGTINGATSEQIPVYNVSFPLMEHANPQQPYMLYDLAPQYRFIAA